jgi:hypothetical protein
MVLASSLYFCIQGVIMSRRNPRQPRRLFRDRPRTPEADVSRLDQLRKVRDLVNPFENYRFQLPDGGHFATTGADLIATAEAMVSLVDATAEGDDRVSLAALERLMSTLD